MAENTGGMNFKVCCPDCDVEQVMAAADIIFFREDFTQAMFACSSGECTDSIVKHVEFQAGLGVSEVAKQGKVETEPTTFQGLLIFIDAALRYAGATTTLDFRNLTMSKILHAFSVLHLKSTRFDANPRAVVWYTAVVEILEKNEQWVDRLETMTKGPVFRVKRAIENLVSQAALSSVTERLVNVIPVLKAAYEDTKIRAEWSDLQPGSPVGSKGIEASGEELNVLVSRKQGFSNDTGSSSTQPVIPPKPSSEHRLHQSV